MLCALYFPKPLWSLCMQERKVGKFWSIYCQCVSHVQFNFTVKEKVTKRKWGGSNLLAHRNERNNKETGRKKAKRKKKLRASEEKRTECEWHRPAFLELITQDLLLQCLPLCSVAKGTVFCPLMLHVHSWAKNCHDCTIWYSGKSWILHSFHCS